MFLILVTLIFSTSVSYGFDIRDIPASNSIEEAKLNLPIKKQKLIEYIAKQEMKDFPFETFKNKALGSVATAGAKLKLGIDIDEVNSYLLDERFQPGLVGTRIKLFGGLCKRYGDYDFVLQELIRVAYYGADKLSPAARKRLYFELLNTTGNKHYKTFRICGVKKVDSENHILMTETARLLTNQILLKETGEDKYDNQANGFNDWMVEHLDLLAKHGFSEINSRPYAGYTVSTLLNLYDFAESQAIKDKARTLLDYLNMKFAMESIGGRRLVLIRRQKKNYNKPRLDNNDAQAAMSMYWFGDYHYLFSDDIDLDDSVLPYGARFAYNAALSSYLPDELIYQHIFNPAEKTVQIYKHEHNALQVVVKTPQLVFSGGGFHVKMWPKWALDNDILPAPAIIIPKNKGSLMSDMIYFLGHNNVKKRNNNCVREGFICGLNLHLPEALKACPMMWNGDWSFYDLSNCEQTVYNGHYLAVYKRELKKKKQADNYGFVEIVKADNSFEEFVKNVQDRNSERFSAGKRSDFVTTRGESIIFRIDPGSRGSHFFLNEQVNPERVYGSHHYLNASRMLIWSPDYRESREYPLLEK